MTISRGNHSLKFGGEVSYERIVHDTLLDNYGVVRVQREQDRQCVRGLPPGTARDDDAGRANSESSTAARTSASSRRTTSASIRRVTLNLGMRYDLQQPLTDPQDRKLALRAWQKIARSSPNAPEGLLFPGDEGVSRGIVKWDRNNIAPRVGMRVGSARRRPHCRFARVPVFSTAASPGTNGTRPRQPAVHGSPDSSRRCSRFQIRIATSPAASARSRSNTTPANPGFTFPAQVFGPSLEFVWPKTNQMNVTARERTVRNVSASASYVGALGRNLPASIDRNYPCSGPRRRPTSIRARPYQPGVSVQHAVAVSRSSPATITACSWPRKSVAAGSPPRCTYRLEKLLKISTIRAADCRLCRTRTTLPVSVPGRRPIGRTRSRSRASGRSATSATRSRSRRALLNNWTASAIVTLQAARR